MKEFRPTATPLVTVDPYFSIWSFDDKLNGDVTRHWTGRANAMSVFIKVDCMWYRIMGHVHADNYRYFKEPPVIEQTSCNVEATQTTYTFESDLMLVEMKFRTPLLLDDLYLISRPVSYISYEVRFKDGKKHEAQMYFDIGATCCVDNLYDEVSFGTTEYSAFCGKGEKDILKSSGDDKMIEWGNLHLIVPGAEYKFFTNTDKWSIFCTGNNSDGFTGNKKVNDDFPVIAATKNYSETNKIKDFYCVAYDDIYSIEYFGESLKPYWKENGDTFDVIVKKAIDEYDEINKRCDEFDLSLRKNANKISEKYADILCLSYRQVIAAHKLVQKDGKLLFFSKECFSDGCIGTVDVTYPSIPMFLLYNYKFVEGMLNPIFEYAIGDHGWNYDFAPHDMGIYPLANGQKYAKIHEDGTEELLHMPVEECGNMLICTAAVCKAANSPEYADDKMDALKKWADCLLEIGYDPEDQLCTDDFAGKMAHNCNLSVKAILAIASFAYILEIRGEDGSFYMNKAHDFAKAWEKEAFDGKCYRLAFDKEDTWSLKYNLVWDRYFDFGLFSNEVSKTEIEFYKTKMNSYGVPLDCRKDYTKSDWQMWTVCLTDDIEYRDMIIEAMWNLITDMPTRVPFSDWYETKVPETSNIFQNRTVQGGLFMPLLF